MSYTRLRGVVEAVWICSTTTSYSREGGGRQGRSQTAFWGGCVFPSKRNFSMNEARPREHRRRVAPSECLKFYLRKFHSSVFRRNFLTSRTEKLIVMIGLARGSSLFVNSEILFSFHLARNSFFYEGVSSHSTSPC